MSRPAGELNHPAWVDRIGHLWAQSWNQRCDRFPGSHGNSVRLRTCLATDLQEISKRQWREGYGVVMGPRLGRVRRHLICRQIRAGQSKSVERTDADAYVVLDAAPGSRARAIWLSTLASPQRGFLFSQAKGFQRPAVSPILADISLTRSNSEVGPTVRLARAEVPNAGREHGSRKRAAGGQDAEAEYNLPKTRQHPKGSAGQT